MRVLAKVAYSSSSPPPFVVLKNKQTKKQWTNKRNVYLNVDLKSLSAICQLWLIKDKLDHLYKVMWSLIKVN